MTPIQGQQTVGTQAFDPGIALQPDALAAYDAAYMASLSPSRRAYMALPYNASIAAQLGLPPNNNRLSPPLLQAQQAAGQLDTQIQVWGDGPGRTMIQRLVQGYKWVYSFGAGSIPVGPGLSIAGLPSYDPSSPPAGAILMPQWDTDGYLMLPAPFPTTPVGPTPISVGPQLSPGLWEVVGGPSPLTSGLYDPSGQYVTVGIPQYSLFEMTTMYYFVKAQSAPATPAATA